jgi:hypothetical protein
MLEKYSARARRPRLPTVLGRALLAAAAAGLLGSPPLLSSCARKSQAGRPAAASSSAVEKPEAASALKREPRDARQSGAKPVPPVAAALRAFGLGVPSIPRIPEDFSLGRLQSYSPAEGDEAAVFGVARKFMDALAAGKPAKELLLPEARDALSVLLAPPPSQGAAARGYRLGAITIKGEDASLMLRMPRAEGSTVRVEGLLSLRKVEGSWYVQALALNPPDSAALAFAPDERGAAK